MSVVYTDSLFPWDEKYTLPVILPTPGSSFLPRGRMLEPPAE